MTQWHPRQRKVWLAQKNQFWTGCLLENHNLIRSLAKNVLAETITNIKKISSEVLVFPDQFLSLFLHNQYSVIQYFLRMQLLPCKSMILEVTRQCGQKYARMARDSHNKNKCYKVKGHLSDDQGCQGTVQFKCLFFIKMLFYCITYFGFLGKGAVKNSTIIFWLITLANLSCFKSFRNSLRVSLNSKSGLLNSDRHQKNNRSIHTTYLFSHLTC